MRIHNITKDDMLNGDGLRVVLWVSGCSHHCKGCQNPITWDPDDGEEFTLANLKEIFSELDKDYVSGITFSGGDPFHPANRDEIDMLISLIRDRYGGSKTIWLYTGYTAEEIIEDNELYCMMDQIDVLVEGRYIEALRDVSLHWRGSSNQRVIDVQKTLEFGDIVLWDDDYVPSAVHQSEKRWCGE